MKTGKEIIDNYNAQDQGPDDESPFVTLEEMIDEALEEARVIPMDAEVILPKPNPQNGGWISVKDEQPPEKRYVIGYIEDAGNIVKCSKILTSDDSLWYYVTHWQHTPKPPLT